REPAPGGPPPGPRAPVRRRDVDGRDRRHPPTIRGCGACPPPSRAPRGCPRSSPLAHLARGAMSLLDRDGSSADALLTDLYLDALLASAVLGAGAVGEDGANGPDLDPAARFAADR